MASNTEVVVSSFAYKTGAPEANLVIDVRFLPDPRPLMEENPELDGTHRVVEDFIRTRGCFDAFFETLKSQITGVFSDLRSRGLTRVEFAFGCTGGQHRSVFVAERLADWLREQLGGTDKIHVHHRELSPRSSADFDLKLLEVPAVPVVEYSTPYYYGDCLSPASSSGSSSGQSSGPSSMTLTYHRDTNAIQIEDMAPMRSSMSLNDVNSMLCSGLDRVRALRERRKKPRVESLAISNPFDSGVAGSTVSHDAL